ncbi:MAG: GIY-YIG nuclease family protein [Peptoniphilaceae bacterium]|uniref:GIY-YIG nuclease family protein n=1 Tax=Parvimonas sp. TaxID=1944660 RepID=UPI0025DA4EDC|nr:GIY-YIG nuclease family protein [Parvimonas sp.]MCI5997838.1 GIY-YIG nuclease family protein [Parvimonas sp.]MDD7764547.1 GIY-YIG nuclease family protein [Peptoniphilaceae bacterium]MDY3050525.1 GIY-YIG nuclease family protein [Parvimonas sp.]
MTFVYILKCADDTLYTGYTTDLKKRLKTHNSKLGAKYTRGRTPVKLVYFELCETKSEALKREKKIKKLKKSEKENMIQNFDTKNLFKYVEGDVNGY